METKINWRTDFKKAKEEAKQSGKFLFLFFHHPECNGCTKTIKETLKDENAIRMLDERFIPMQITITEEEDLSCKYCVEWTPSFLIADSSGNELDKWEGFLPAKEFIPQVILAEGLSYFRKQEYEKAVSCLTKVVHDYRSSGFAPQATYYLGICQYKGTHDPSYLNKTWEELHKKFPESYWTKKASPFHG